VGVEGLLELNWSIWDAGVTHAKVEQAELAVTQSEQHRLAVERDVQTAWSRARADVDRLATETASWRTLQPNALDAYLYAESLYRGGAGSGLDVLDAFDDWTDTALGLVDATLAYRSAEAELQRLEGR
jgi:outer membrane protein TolC